MYEDEEIEESRLVKDLRKQIKDKEKLLTERESELAKFQTQAKRASVADLLGSKGVDKRLAKFAIADGVEDEAGITAWLAENGEVFGITEAAPAPVEDEDEMKRVQSATSSGAQTAASPLAASFKDADNAQTPEEWKAAVFAARAGESA